MSKHETTRSSTTEGLPVSPSLGPTLSQAQVPPHYTLMDRRVVFMCLFAAVVGIACGLVAIALKATIGLITNVTFYGRISSAMTPQWPAVHGLPGHPHVPAMHWPIANLGWWVIPIPIIGGIITGLMARYGSTQIRGHGLPEAMESVLINESRMQARVSWLKPLSAAIAIGTGGPFGAEGPIIATGAAIGSMFGQWWKTTTEERKILLAAGAAGGMAATFGSPISSVLLVIELLLFEFRPRSFIPVAFASVAAEAVRVAFNHGRMTPIFELHGVTVPTFGAMGIYVVIGLIAGFAAVGVTRVVYAIEDGYEKLPIHWMWWPTLGALVVGVIGYFSPRTLGVGYDVIRDVLNNGVHQHLVLTTLIMLAALKFVSWAVYLSSGTSGGTMAPLFIIGSAMGGVLGLVFQHLIPGAHVNLGLAGLVGMAALFGGASRTLLAVVVFAFETTHEPLGILPVLAGCAASYLVASLLMQETIMTTKIARRGVHVPADYSADLLELISVQDVATKEVKTLPAEQSIDKTLAWLNTDSPPRRLPQGFPVVDESGILVGMVTRWDLIARKGPGKKVREAIRRPPILCYDDTTLRDAVGHMVNHNVGRMPVVKREHPGKVVGIITRSDILSVYRRRLHETRRR